MSVVFSTFDSFKEMMFHAMLCVLSISFISVRGYQVKGGIHGISALCAAAGTDAFPKGVLRHH